MSGSPLASFSGLHRRVPFFFEGHTKIIAGKGGGGVFTIETVHTFEWAFSRDTWDSLDPC